MTDEIFFQTGYGKQLPRIIAWSVVFHVLVVLLVVAGLFLQSEPKIKTIPVFELVQLPPQKGVRHRPKPKPRPRPEPVKSRPKVKPQVKQEIKPEIKPESKPEPKTPPKVEEPKPEPPSQEEPQKEAEAASSDDFELPEGDPHGMDLPDFSNQPALRTVESILIDPLMQVYLEQLQAILMQNFNPPSELQIAKGAHTTVQFTIQRGGAITAVMLKKSSGNASWDRLAMRAVNLSKLPPLPPNYRAPVLPLVFDFREK
ncbi:MAG TPA: TonB family protein [Fibrobacteraceae bacterium]|nr:TonB family protein [Fibrobacteraceae bacterium]